MDAQESEDDQATPSVVPELTAPSSGRLTSEEVATLVHDLTQAIIAARSNPLIT